MLPAKSIFIYCDRKEGNKPMFCLVCGKELKSNAKFCEGCGHAVNISNNDTVQYPPQSETLGTQQTQPEFLNKQTQFPKDTSPSAQQQSHQKEKARANKRDKKPKGKKWLISLFVAIIGFIIIIAVVSTMSSNTDTSFTEYIKTVQTGYLGAYFDVSIAEVLESFVQNGEWDGGKTDSGQRIVEYKANGPPGEFTIQFTIMDENSFIVSAMDMMGITPASQLELARFVQSLYDNYYTYISAKEVNHTAVEYLSGNLELILVGKSKNNPEVLLTNKPEYANQTTVSNNQYEQVQTTEDSSINENVINQQTDSIKNISSESEAIEALKDYVKGDYWIAYGNTDNPYYDRYLIFKEFEEYGETDEFYSIFAGYSVAGKWLEEIFRVYKNGGIETINEDFGTGVDFFRLSPGHIYTDYMENPILAEKLYKDKLIFVYGNILGIHGGEYPEIQIIEPGWSGSKYGIECYFQDENVLLSLKTGDFIEVIGYSNNLSYIDDYGDRCYELVDCLIPTIYNDDDLLCLTMEEPITKDDNEDKLDEAAYSSAIEISLKEMQIDLSENSIAAQKKYTQYNGKLVEVFARVHEISYWNGEAFITVSDKDAESSDFTCICYFDDEDALLDLKTGDIIIVQGVFDYSTQYQVNRPAMTSCVLLEYINDDGTEYGSSLINSEQDAINAVIEYWKYASDPPDIYEVLETHPGYYVVGTGSSYSTSSNKIDTIHEVFTEDGRIEYYSSEEYYPNLLSYDYSDEYLLPYSSTYELLYDDLDGFTSTELRIAKNEIYARHGRQFQSKDLQDYFNSKSWYSSLPKLPMGTEPTLSSIEKTNIEMITECESMVENGVFVYWGGEESDEDYEW